MKKILLLIFLSSALLIGVAFGLWKIFLTEEVKPIPGALTAEDLLEYTVETGDITTNLKSGGFIQVKFQIQGDSIEAKEELTNRMFQIRNIVIYTLSTMTKEELKGSEKTVALEHTIQEKMNEQLTDGQVMKVFTTKKLLQ